MKTDLKDYIKIYNGVVPPDICKQTIKCLQDVSWIEHRFYSSTGLIDNGKEPYECHETINTSEVLDKCIWESLRTYIIDDTGFPWFNGWQGFSKIKFIKYNENSEMENHCDHIHSLYDGHIRGIPILTVIGVLNNDFTGGNLTLFEDYSIELDEGDIVVFPSVFLYPHKVEKITSGNRYSFVSWCS
jgi:hypothetical protein